MPHNKTMSRDVTEVSSEDEQPHQISLETPIILSRNLIPSLTKGLDASDALECYVLIRSAPLHGIANATISVQKMALGIRYRPAGGNDLVLPRAKRPMELTLEYGPQRVGPLLNDEALPVVQVEESTSYLSWDNVGKVYFTRKIVKQNFLSSYYMASMTGAVLDQLLTEAVDYTERRKVYQPFSLYSEENGRELRSSSSSDFVWYIWAHLAKLGVEIDPILPPPVYEARLHVKSISKAIPEPAVAHQAAIFYQKLYACLDAIATNNYASFGQSTELPADAPTASGDGDDGSKRNNDNSGGTRRRYTQESPTSDKSSHETSAEESSPSLFESEKDSTIKQGASTEPGTFAETNPPSLAPSLSLNFTPEPSFEDEFPPEDDDIADQEIGETDDDEVSSATEEEPDKGGHGVEKTQQAADEAQKAADEAKEAAETEGETKAADAAQAAANAAQAAADATSEAASKAAMDSILSGDGSMMSSIISSCLSNPQYEIASDDGNGTIITEGYLYRDSSFYYKLELTSPYLSVVKLNRGLPKAVVLSGNGSGGDAVDWLLALTIGFSVLLMVLLICQQMGNRWVGSILRCQRWYFNPRKQDYDGDSMTGGQSGSLFFFGESGIPLSMGGRRSSYSPIGQQDSLQQVIAVPAVVHEDLDENVHYPSLSSQLPTGRRKSASSMEFEMTSLNADDKDAAAIGQGPLHLQIQRETSSASLGSDEGIVPDRLFRDPSLVEMPSLKSKSRVAVPVGSASTPCGSANNSRHKSSSSMDDGGSVASVNSHTSFGESPFTESTFL